MVDYSINIKMMCENEKIGYEKMAKVNISIILLKSI